MQTTQEYAALKSEIQQCIEFEFSAQTTMITLVVAIFAIAFQQGNAWLFMIAYLPLIHFQTVMNKKRNGRLRIAAYIQVFYSEYGSWESIIYEVGKRTYTTNSRDPFYHHLGIISKMTAFSFSLLVAICSIFHFFITNPPTHTNSPILCWHLLIHLLCISVIYSVNSKVFTGKTVSDRYVEIFQTLKHEQESRSSSCTDVCGEGPGA